MVAIMKAEEDHGAAINPAAAVRTMGEGPDVMQLRALEATDRVGPTVTNTDVIAVPIELRDIVKYHDASRKNESRSPAKTPASGTAKKSVDQFSECVTLNVGQRPSAVADDDGRGRQSRTRKNAQPLFSRFLHLGFVTSAEENRPNHLQGGSDQ